MGGSGLLQRTLPRHPPNSLAFFSCLIASEAEIAEPRMRGSYMKRREFITLLGGAAGMAARGARAAGGRSCRPSGSWARDASAGVHGRLLLCSDCVNSAGSRVAPSRSSIAGRRDAPSAYAEIAAEFVRLKVDVIVTNGTAVPSSKAGDSGHPHRLCDWRSTRSAAAWSQVWRDRAATSLDCRSSDRSCRQATRTLA